MNQKPLESARNADLPASYEALKRAARRARELARQTRTALVIGEAGRIRLIVPHEEDAGRPDAGPSSNGAPT